MTSQLAGGWPASADPSLPLSAGCEVVSPPQASKSIAAANPARMTKRPMA
ncbi:hypothetical protein AKJ09_02390 [Labilithrix luteola]|uniref:Uncharacterized protein n=1 Tax=Labilithrix luteola TaxID=1391654 RepID=A0A0K1PQT2_9BACT|nr:hypothetical protein [Labilithrix luteola]AKU95726.1 hypothetical protein AKJ09_02390 [Labilithrix luteola]